ncbi:FG-GAP repeat domain-containing protein [Nonomuraea sp. NPDC003727]
MIERLRTGAAAFCSVVLITGGVFAAQAPSISAAEEDRLAGRFAFRQTALNTTDTRRTVRAVAPAYKRISHWISSVGAGLAMDDVDGNGRPDDVCLVDTRDDSVTIRPVPGTGDRYPVVTLTPGSLPYTSTMAPTGCVTGDFDQNGSTDAMVYYWGRSPVLFLRTGSTLAFTAQELVKPYQVWNSNAASLADVDGDGRTDIVIGNYFPDGARVLDPAARQDELHMQTSMSSSVNGGVNRILLNAGKPGEARFSDVPGVLDAAVARSWTLAIGAQDLNGDGLPELYFANDFGADHLLRNLSTPGRPRFEVQGGIRHLTTPKSKVLGRDSFKGMGVAFTHLNDDGAPDMVVSNITEEFALQESNFAWVSTRREVLGAGGTAHYDDLSEPLGLSRSGWGWDIKAGDFGGDGDVQVLQATGFVAGEDNRWANLQELAMANDVVVSNPTIWPQVIPGDDISGSDPNPFFARDRDGRFHDIAARLGVADPGVSRGIALADVDHDGKLDFAVANQWRASYVYRNTRPTDLPYLGLTLKRPAGCGSSTATTPAVGASVTLRSGAAGISAGQLYPANGHGGVSASELLFALADPKAPVPVTVTWRDGCGTRHTTDATLKPGWHELVLRPEV